ncbi:MAG: OB-fold nucleic acid binding domain-containing protein, partial [Phenylobacterium sp.]
MHQFRTHTCGALRAADEGQTVRLSGWIHRKRDHGGLMFIDLRDHYGLTQLVLAPETPGFAVAERARAESVIKIDGQVVKRTPETINAGLPTGEVEVRVRAIEVLSEAAELPLPVFGEPEYPEEIRLKNRHLDLRRETLHRNIVLRSKVIQSIRPRMTDHGILEFQTPIQTPSTPPGAPDLQVPSPLPPTKIY